MSRGESFMDTVVEAAEVEDVHVFVAPNIILEPARLSDHHTSLLRLMVPPVILRGQGRGCRENHLRYESKRYRANNTASAKHGNEKHN